MDNPPPNYNPNESVLSGGINSSVPIQMVQGGGGGNPLNNYNETASVLEGGIVNHNAPIVEVQGGGGENSIQIIENYNLLDESDYTSFITSFTPEKTSKANKELQAKLEALKEKTLRYTKRDTYVESSTVNNSKDIISIKFVPSSTKNLVILPEFSDPKNFVNQLMFLIKNEYLKIDSKKNFIVEPNVFIISLASFTDELMNFFYLKVKVSNPYSFYKINDPFVFVYLKQLDDKKGILISKSDFKFLKPSKMSDLAPIDQDTIKENSIKTMKYKGNPEEVYDNFHVISEGADPASPIVENYTFTLAQNIAVINLIEEDIQKITIEIQGQLYRVRVPYTPSVSMDPIYKNWSIGNFEKDELSLVRNLKLDEIKDFDIPRFLFHLTYFKCFDDVSLLTKQECSYMKQELQKVYAYSLEKKEKRIERTSEGGEDLRIIETYDCSEINVEDNPKIVCKVLYKEKNKKQETTVEISKDYIPILKSSNPEDMKKIEKAVETEFRK